MARNPDIRWRQRFANYTKALGQLTEARRLTDPDILQKQGTIQCFEYTFELAWKTLQDFLIQERGYADRGPRPTIERAFQDGIIADGVTWMDMLKSRNLTTHLYDENEVERIYTKVVAQYYRHFVALRDFFEAQP
ncbi:MAG: nucleotidyltransferase substrate binding protein [Deltaproteobacteria bacterium]|nr:nucleotidyltransferase substrate binding protein [Deltaproteobacteria bacterium]